MPQAEPPIAPTAAQVHAALEELLEWQGISRSPQLADLLRYVVEKTLAGDVASIKAYSIAVDVFGRPPSFDPQSDPIVRVQARRLRTLLEQFYASGRGHESVRIELPLGRYVPEFSYSAPALPNRPEVTTLQSPATSRLGAAVRRRSSSLLAIALVALAIMLAGVSLTVFLVRVTVQPPPSVAVSVPDEPQISVGIFDNLTGNDALDGTVARFGAGLANALHRFDDITVGGDGGGMVVRGTIQENRGAYSVRAILSGSGSSGIVWSTTISAPTGLDASEALDSAIRALAAQLASTTGPLHAAARTWLKQQNPATAPPTPYVCDLKFMTWRENRRVENSEAASTCLTGLLANDPDNPRALAALAVLDAWRIGLAASPSEDIAQSLANQVASVTRAALLAPDSSFVLEQSAVVLAQGQNLAGALAAAAKAMKLNPASTDAMAIAGLLQWANGSFADGNELSERALGAVPSPPPWYYLTRALNLLREQQFFDAIEAGQAVAAGNDVVGLVVALAAAPRVTRTDLVERYRPVVLRDPTFQTAGILPRLKPLIRQQVVLDRIRDGLILAGLPPNTLLRPFNPDGTEQK